MVSENLQVHNLSHGVGLASDGDDLIWGGLELNQAESNIFIY